MVPKKKCIDQDDQCESWTVHCASNQYVQGRCPITCNTGCAKNLANFVVATTEKPKLIFTTSKKDEKTEEYVEEEKIEPVLEVKIIETTKTPDSTTISTTKPETTTAYQRTTQLRLEQTTTSTTQAPTSTPLTTTTQSTTTSTQPTTTTTQPATTTTTKQTITTTQPSNYETLSQALARCSQVERATAQLDAEMSARSNSGFVSSEPCQDHSNRCEKMTLYCDDSTVATLCAKTCNRCDLSKSKAEIDQIRNNIQSQASNAKVDAKQNIEYLECQKIKEQQKACVDLLDDDECAGYSDYCENSTMQKQCKRTCGVCKNPGEVITTTTTTTLAPKTAAGGTCADSNSNCMQWKNYCMSLDDVKQACPVTCGTC